eukprot:NODE_50_length_27150_cov_0.307308.p12 type:complete len:172 gc:universal NODE_50_length_27150_cov_0.307308:20972-21487(+)
MFSFFTTGSIKYLISECSRNPCLFTSSASKHKCTICMLSVLSFIKDNSVNFSKSILEFLPCSSQNRSKKSMLYVPYLNASLALIEPCFETSNWLNLLYSLVNELIAKKLLNSHFLSLESQFSRTSKNSVKIGLRRRSWMYIFFMCSVPSNSSNFLLHVCMYKSCSPGLNSS